MFYLPALDTHTFKKMEFQPAEAKKFFSTVRKEMALLATSLPDGIMVKTFEDRMVSALHNKMQPIRSNDFYPILSIRNFLGNQMLGNMSCLLMSVLYCMSHHSRTCSQL